MQLAAVLLVSQRSIKRSFRGDKMRTLQDQAQQTIDIEFRGMSLDTALLAAQERIYIAKTHIAAFDTALQQAQYNLDQVTCDYHDAVRAAHLLQNAIDELDNQDEGISK